MANDLTGNPLYIDTASANALLTSRIEVLTIRWYSPSASAGHTVIVQDQDGNEKWPSVAAGSNHVEESKWFPDHPLVMSGLLIPTLASGRLLIHVKGRIPA